MDITQGPFSRLTSAVGGAPVAGVIVKGAQQGAGALPGGRIRRITWTNKGAAAHFAQIFCDPINCGAPGAPTSTPGNPVVLPTSTTTQPSYSADVSIVATAGSTFVFDFGVDGAAAPGGIILAASSTADVFTALAGKDAVWTIEYR